MKKEYTVILCCTDCMEGPEFPIQYVSAPDAVSAIKEAKELVSSDWNEGEEGLYSPSDFCTVAVYEGHIKSLV